MTKMAAMPIYGKNPLKNLLSRNQWNDFNETWYVASGTQAHHYLFKLWPRVDLDLFYGKVKFCNIGFYIEKCNSDGFFGNYCSLSQCDLKIGRHT